ncbi:uncharacterized protein [Palaemon carinicauda]|uniref:uncharacterized protein n=1 Tax=Palaemon carinicauda TaxID=392227 RepID=UPI0035B581BC
MITTTCLLLGLLGVVLCQALAPPITFALESNELDSIEPEEVGLRPIRRIFNDVRYPLQMNQNWASEINNEPISAGELVADADSWLDSSRRGGNYILRFGRSIDAQTSCETCAEEQQSSSYRRPKHSLSSSSSSFSSRRFHLPQKE